jgi:ADP-heptose:LPS heptosyltransferase
VAETLVIYPGALGDVLLTVPALRALRSAFPDDTLALATQPRIGELLTALRVVDRAIPFDSLDLHTLFVDGPRPARSERLAQAARVVSWFGARDETFVRRLRAIAPGAVLAPPIPATDTAVWEHFLNTVWGQASDPARLVPVAVPEPLAEEGRRRLGAMGWDGTTRLLMIHPGAGGMAKRWPVEGFARLLEALLRDERLGVVIHEGPADTDAVTALAARHRDTIRLAEPPLPLLAGVLSHFAAYVGNDSGISHLSATVGTPSVVLLTTATLAWRPWAAAARPVVVTTAMLEEDDVARVLGGVRALLA